MVIPDETWKSHSHVLYIPSNLLSALFFPAQHINTLRCSGKKTHDIHQHEIPPCVLLSTQELGKAFLLANKKLLAKDIEGFPPLPDDTMKYLLMCLGPGLH